MSTISSLAKLLQTWKIHKHRKGGTVAVSYFLISLTTALVWFMYGVTIRDLAISASSGLGLGTTSSIIIVYIYYEK